VGEFCQKQEGWQVCKNVSINSSFITMTLQFACIDIENQADTTPVRGGKKAWNCAKEFTFTAHQPAKITLISTRKHHKALRAQYHSATATVKSFSGSR